MKKLAVLFCFLTVLFNQAQAENPCEDVLDGGVRNLTTELRTVTGDLEIEQQEAFKRIKKSMAQTFAALYRLENFRQKLTWAEKHLPARWVGILGGNPRTCLRLQKMEEHHAKLRAAMDADLRDGQSINSELCETIENWLQTHSLKWARLRQAEKQLKQTLCTSEACLKKAVELEEDVGDMVNRRGERLWLSQRGRSYLKKYKNSSVMFPIKSEWIPNLIQLQKQLKTLDLPWVYGDSQDFSKLAHLLSLADTAAKVIEIRQELESLHAELLSEQQEIESYIQKTLCEALENCRL